MHSRIFQISSKPINKDEYITADDYDYDHWFLREIADYTDDINEYYQTNTLEWLNDFDGISVDANNRTIVIESKVDYFLDKYTEFKNMVADLSRISLKDFSGLAERNKINQYIYRLNAAYQDKFGFYVDDGGEYGGLITFDEWVRCAAKENVTYYIGGIVDYHS